MAKIKVPKKLKAKNRKSTRDVVIAISVAISLLVLFSAWAMKSHFIRRSRDKYIMYNDTMLCPHENRLEHVFTMMDWDVEHAEAKVSGINISYNRRGDRGLFVTRPFRKGEVIISIPLEATLSISGFSGRNQINDLTAGWDLYDEDADQYLDVLPLLTELLVNNQNSPFLPYICTLVPATAYYNLPLSLNRPADIYIRKLMPEFDRLVEKRSRSLDAFLPLFLRALKVTVTNSTNPYH